MMFYTTISGWMLIYFIKYADGSILAYKSAEELGAVFGTMISNPVLMVCATFTVILVCFSICSFGLQKGVERITKWMMVALLLLMVGLAIYSCTLSNAAEGLKFYLVPSLKSLENSGVWTVISSAMGQAFFTLSIGIGSIAIFGSYIGKERRLLGEAVTIVGLDTFVALMSGVIIFPACFTYNGGVTADAGTVGASFLFTTLSSIFNSMPGGRIVGALFFVFMIFAAFSTVIAVFENIMSFWLELTKLSRRKVALINIALRPARALPPLRARLQCARKNTDSRQGHHGYRRLPRFKCPAPARQSRLCSLLQQEIRLGLEELHRRSQLRRKGRKNARLPIRPYFTYVLPIIVIIVFIMSVVG